MWGVFFVMINKHYLKWSLYIFFSLIFTYQVLTSTNFIIRYISFLCSIFEISMFIFEVGIYNYHKGNLMWLDEE